MPHPLDLSPALQSALYKPNMPPVRVRVYFEGRAKTVTGGTAAFPTFSATYSDVTWEITDWLKARPVVTFQKPILPDGKYNNRISAGTLSLQFVNATGYLAATGQGGILDPVNIDSGEIVVRIAVEGSVDEIDLYRGRIAAQPSERFGETEISLRDTLWDVLKTEMPFEQYNFLPGGIAGMQYYQGILYYSSHETNYGFIAHGPYTTFLEDGAIAAAVDNGGGDIDLNFANIKNGSAIGEYLIRFSTATSYTVSVPDGQSFHGSINNVLDTPSIALPPSAFNTVAGAKPGDEITLQIGNAARGNPAAIAAAMIEKGLLRNFGSDPGTANNLAALPVVWSSFENLKYRFWGWELSTVFTNEDNAVFERKSGNRPLTYLEAAQFCMDHIGANILRDGRGQIYTQGPYADDATIYTLDSASAIISHSIEGVRKYNYLTIQYGKNEYTGAYGSTVDFDLRIDPDNEPEVATITLPGFKIGDNVHEVDVAATIYRERALNSVVRIQAELTPQFAQSVAPGDRYFLNLTKPPIISGYFEAYRVRIESGGTATVNFHQIPAPTGAVFAFGAFVFGVSQLG